MFKHDYLFVEDSMCDKPLVTSIGLIISVACARNFEMFSLAQFPVIKEPTYVRDYFLRPSGSFELLFKMYQIDSFSYWVMTKFYIIINV